MSVPADVRHRAAMRHPYRLTFLQPTQQHTRLDSRFLRERGRLHFTREPYKQLVVRHRSEYIRNGISSENKKASRLTRPLSCVVCVLPYFPYGTFHVHLHQAKRQGEAAQVSVKPWVLQACAEVATAFDNHARLISCRRRASGTRYESRCCARCCALQFLYRECIICTFVVGSGDATGFDCVTPHRTRQR